MSDRRILQELCVGAYDCYCVARLIVGQDQCPEAFAVHVADICAPLALDYAEACGAHAASRRRAAGRIPPDRLAESLDGKHELLLASLRRWAHELAGPRQDELLRHRFGARGPRFAGRPSDLCVRAFVTAPFWAMTVLLSGPPATAQVKPTTTDEPLAIAA